MEKDYIGEHPAKQVPKVGFKRGIRYQPRILVLGGNGFFGKNLRPYLESYWPNADIIDVQGRRFFDLTIQNECRICFERAASQGPINIVINLAAYSGGMFENMNHHARFYYQNSMINLNVMDECARYKVNKLLVPIGGCSYPDTNEYNGGTYTEDEIWNGFANKNSYGYSMAKRNAIVGALAYSSEFNLNTTVVIPTNPIGPWDNVDEKNAHLPMALIGRFLEAIAEGYSTVTVYGSGRPERDFLYIGDIVSLYPAIIDHYGEIGPLNISSGKGTTIAEMAELIAKTTGFTGKIHFDRSKPDGQMKKVLDNSKLLEFVNEYSIKWEPMGLEESIETTVEWYRKRILGE